MSKKTQEAAGEGQATVNVVAEEPTYTAVEFARAAETVFGKETSPDIVLAAFRKAGREKAGIPEAKKLVEAFANKEVK